MRDAKVCAMRKFVANFMRLRSEAEERWNRARPVLCVGPFRFTFVIKIPRVAANYSPLAPKREEKGEGEGGGGEEGGRFTDGTCEGYSPTTI